MSLPQTRFTITKPLTVADVMPMTGHTNRAAFLRFVHQSGLPRININRRRIMFDENALNQWLASRSAGKVPANPSLN